MSDHYETLGVERNATDDEIRRAYRELARRYHPDSNAGDPAAEERFKEISAAYEVLRNAGTEQPYSSALNDEHRAGTFTCAGCGQALFASSTKFDSGTGWPSFYRALDNAVLERPDNSAGMSRTEVLCSRCGGHLGHVFDDGPQPTGLRYCMNGVAMGFKAS